MERRLFNKLPMVATASAILAILLVSCGGDDDAVPTPGRTVAATTTRVASSPTIASSPPASVPSAAVATGTAATLATPPFSTPSPASIPALCGAGAAKAPSGVVASPDLIEISGLAASRTQPGVLWAHNDSGDTARVFAMDTAGQSLGTYTLAGAEAIDWEDMAIGPGPEEGASYLYLGDIGDNASIRPEIVVYRVKEPTVDPASSQLALANVKALTLVYPDGAHDAETLLVDPINGDLFIITKDISGGPSRVFLGADSAPVVEGIIGLEEVAQIDFGALTPTKIVPPDSPALPTALGRIPTGGDISPAGDLIAIRTYGTVWIWTRPPGTSLADAFASPPCEGPSEIEAQGEAIAIGSDGASYFTASEGLNVALHDFRGD